MEPLKRRWEIVKRSVLAALAEEQQDAAPKEIVILSEARSAQPKDLRGARTAPPLVPFRHATWLQ